jgi:hypothetical protein
METWMMMMLEWLQGIVGLRMGISTTCEMMMMSIEIVVNRAAGSSWGVFQDGLIKGEAELLPLIMIDMEVGSGESHPASAETST